ncbi:MAG: tRNA (adenosine(37)-N6)-threonylcarbamoyltransferase complex transferase subunit TsaD [Acidobacteriota bacterium]
MSLILGIETSCDDSSAALLHRDGRVVSCRVAGQDEVHAPYGGVVPELASRAHLQKLPGTVEGVLADAGCTLADVEEIAVSCGPGLLGSLLVGVAYANALGWAKNLPVRGVNHIEAHLRSPWIERPDLPYPALGLVVSGGHTHLFWCRTASEIQRICATRDDAAGEALDKLAKHLGLPYPGGPVIDRLAERGNPRAVLFPLPRMSSGDPLDFSFSGLKSAALHWLRSHGYGPPFETDTHALPGWEYDLLASFQKRVVDHLIQRMRVAAIRRKPACLTMAGGVACNRLLRRRLLALGEELGVPAAFPSPRYCTDNAAMVAFRALDGCGPARPGVAPLDAFPTAHWTPSG